MTKKKTRKRRTKKADTAKWGRPAGPIKTTHPHQRLVIPSGYCPVKLEGNDRESIRHWIVKLTQKKDDNTTYLASVYKYWASDFYVSYSQECKDVREIIDSIVTCDVNKVSDIGK